MNEWKDRSICGGRNIQARALTLKCERIHHARRIRGPIRYGKGVAAVVDVRCLYGSVTLNLGHRGVRGIGKCASVGGLDSDLAVCRRRKWMNTTTKANLNACSAVEAYFAAAAVVLVPSARCSLLNLSAHPFPMGLRCMLTCYHIDRIRNQYLPTLGLSSRRRGKERFGHHRYHYHRLW